MFFRTLSENEKKEFREFAEHNDPPANWRTICHPVCVEVWIRRGFADADKIREPESLILHADESRPRMKIRVFRDHPDFDRLGKWWMLDSDLLNDLHVATYSLWRREPDPILGAECDPGDTDVELAIAEIHREHPGCVLVY
jgi:hypothetical protein